MNAWDWYVKVLKQYVDFSGRARRKEYWFFALISLLISLGLFLVDACLFGYRFTPAHPHVAVLANLYGLGVLLPSLGVLVRRLHDTDRSAWWLFMYLVPLIGPILILVFLFLDSTPGPNRFGPNPKDVHFRV
jgi:uncharacterized membrane protein YhaH (DUF805 family)